jgi:hypothetical protein
MGNTSRLSTHDAAWLAETFRRNRERFAGWRMEVDPPPADNPPATDPPADPPADPAAADDGKGGKDAILADLAKERDKRQALEQTVNELKTAQQSQLDAIATALGLKSDDNPPDPAALTAQVEAEQARAREAALHLAVYRHAGAHEANPDALLDSASFLRSLAEVDPTNADAVSAAIKAAVDANPLHKAAPPAQPTPPFPGGPRQTPPTQAGSLGEAIATRLTRTR